MLIPGKSHSWVERRNSRVSIETPDFAQVCTFYRRDRSQIASGGAKGYPIAAYDIAGGSAPERRKKAGGGYGGSMTGEVQWPSAHGQRTGELPPPPIVGRRWTIGRRHGRMGA